MGQVHVGFKQPSASGGIYTFPAMSSTSPRPTEALPAELEVALAVEHEVLHYGLGLVTAPQQQQQPPTPEQVEAAWRVGRRRLLMEVGPSLTTDLVVACTSTEPPGSSSTSAPPATTAAVAAAVAAAATGATAAGPPGIRVLDKDVVSLHLESMPAFRRSFLVAAAGTFHFLQKHWEEGDMFYNSGDFEKRNHVLINVCARYRRNLNEYIAELNRVHVPALGEVAMSEVYIMEAIKAVWGLTEALYITCNRRMGSCNLALSLRLWVAELRRTSHDDQFPFLMG